MRYSLPETVARDMRDWREKRDMMFGVLCMHV
jgi:hypothetical protein